LGMPMSAGHACVLAAGIGSVLEREDTGIGQGCLTGLCPVAAGLGSSGK
jgi:hypothetical protein